MLGDMIGGPSLMAFSSLSLGELHNGHSGAWRGAGRS